MARYTYNEGLVSQTIDTLGDACKTLDQTNTDINKGISTILNARGAENMNIDFSPILEYQSTVVDYIDQFTGELKSKAQEIEEYENAPWWKKLFATIGMGALKIIEGFIGVNENVIDGLVSVVGFIGGLFSSEFKDSVGEFIKKDWVGDTTAKWYTEGWLKGLNKYSYMSHESTAANILKGVGNAAGYVAISFIPYVGPALSIAASTAGAVGSGTQAGLQQGMSYNQAFGQGMKQGAVALATSLIAKGVANKLTSLGTAAGATDDLIGMTDDFANGAGKSSEVLKSLAQTGGEYADDLDEVAKLLGKTGELAKNGTNIANKLTALKAAGALGEYADDFDDIIKTAGNLGANYSSAAATAGDVVKGIGKGKVGEVASSIGDKVMKGKVGEVITGAGKYVAKAAAASPHVVPAVSTGLSVVTSGTTKSNDVSSAYRQFNSEVAEYEEKVAFVEDSYESVRGDAVPTTATEEEAKQNLQTLKDNGYNPGSGSPTVEDPPVVNDDIEVTPIATEAPVATPKPSVTPSGPSGPTPTVTVTVPPVQISDPVPTQTPTVPTPTQPSLDDIVSNVVIDPNPTNPTNVDPVANNTSLVDMDATNEEVLNTFGDVSGAVTGAGSRTNIPTSSSPILSSEDGSSRNKSMLPLGAGLGAATLSGIGAKVMMDRNAKKKEEEQDIETDEWTEQDSMEIDYQQHEDSEEADYLNPTDELAFQE